MGDAGYRGYQTSLGGIVSRRDTGLTIEQSAKTVVPGDTQTIATVNGRRVWLLIQCVSDVGAYVWLDEQPAVQAQLNRYDTLLINKDMPWTGPISAASRDAALNSTLVVIEASVEGS